MSSSAQPVEEASVGELTARLSHDLSTLMRDELRLAQVETSDKAKKVGLGVGLFGVSGLIAYFGGSGLGRGGDPRPGQCSRPLARGGLSRSCPDPHSRNRRPGRQTRRVGGYATRSYRSDGRNQG